LNDSTLLESKEIAATKHSWIWFALTSGLVLIFLVSLFLGRYPQAGFVQPGQLRENELARLLVSMCGCRACLPRCCSGW